MITTKKPFLHQQNNLRFLEAAGGFRYPKARTDIFNALRKEL
jgi:hypothetical protein